MTGGIYVSSRANVPGRPGMWRGLRRRGWPIVSTWIDEPNPRDFAELWSRIHREIHLSCGLVFYAEASDFPVRGAGVEVGIALGLGKRVVACLPGVELEGPTLRPVGTWLAHPLVVREDCLANALAALCDATPAPGRAADRTAASAARP